MELRATSPSGWRRGSRSTRSCELGDPLAPGRVVSGVGAAEGRADLRAPRREGHRCGDRLPDCRRHRRGDVARLRTRYLDRRVPWLPFVCILGSVFGFVGYTISPVPLRRTIGKKLMGIRVVARIGRADQPRPGAPAHPFFAQFFFIDALFVLFTEKPPARVRADHEDAGGGGVAGIDAADVASGHQSLTHVSFTASSGRASVLSASINH